MAEGGRPVAHVLFEAMREDMRLANQGRIARDKKKPFSDLPVVATSSLPGSSAAEAGAMNVRSTTKVAAPHAHVPDLQQGRVHLLAGPIFTRKGGQRFISTTRRSHERA